MNRYKLLFTAAWSTRNAGKQRSLEVLCKNYGMTRLQNTMYAGLLYAKERVYLYKKLQTVLAGKRDQLHTFTMCQSCSREAVGESIELSLKELPSYELIQSPEKA